MAETRKFKLRTRDGQGNPVAPHFEKNPDGGEDIEFKPGSIVESDRDLRVVFPNKFDLLEHVQEGPSLEEKDREIAKLKQELEELKAFKVREEGINPNVAAATAQGRTPTPEELNEALKAQDEGSEPDDATSDFEGASEKGFVVKSHKKGKKVVYSLTQNGELIEDGMSKTKVAAFIKDSA